MISLHLGCGDKYLPEFTYHIDKADYNHIDLQHDIGKLPMFENDSVDLIYCCHALEYYDRVEVVEVLKEWNRILRLGGILRLAVPDFEAWVKVYQQTGKVENLLGALYGRWQIGNTDKIIYHKTCYDFQSLKRILEDCGFNNVHRYDDFSRCFYPHLKICKSMDEYESGMLVGLNVEASKC
jgi:predicted SAM-dependent methyltransferase